MFARVSTVISIYISLGCVRTICLSDYFVFMYINASHTLSFMVCGKRDDKVNIYLH